MAIYSDGQIVATMHDFKTNISKYVRMLERGEYRAVLVRCLRIRGWDYKFPEFRSRRTLSLGHPVYF